MSILSANLRGSLIKLKGLQPLILYILGLKFNLHNFSGYFPEDQALPLEDRNWCLAIYSSVFGFTVDIKMVGE